MDKKNLDLETESIGKLLFNYSLPAIIATTASSLYNIIDRIIIGQGVGPLAISGLALTFPIMNLAVAFGTLVGAGLRLWYPSGWGKKNAQKQSEFLAMPLCSILLSVLYFRF
jgi:Na+-driven multidrug efflux pump